MLCTPAASSVFLFQKMLGSLSRRHIKKLPTLYIDENGPLCNQRKAGVSHCQHSHAP